ncbi:hypothetical protein [Burkholderia pseudomallei]|uniref:hypothetical protein n=1 Tax=Burkholderia pseudomallei TaxID=28450 RepID=UPI0009754173|nr:hypothetical protein [Burkholderia pseudomallei]ONA10937.1 hypothetical protein AQ875_21405 [Burkholderia pseudomallei]
MENLKYDHIADLLYDLYYATYAGKTRGRFFLTKDQMKTLAGRAALQKATIDGIAKVALKKYGLAMAAVEGGYGFIEQDKVSAWRPVPAIKLNKIAKIGQKEHVNGWEAPA